MTEKTKKILLWIFDLAINLAIIFGLVLIIQKWLIAPFDVSGASMCDTLNIIDGKCVNEYGEKIIINEATYLFNEPERGDIVVFKADKDIDKYFIKRVIGLPEETVEIRNGYIYITKKGETSSTKLEENYLNLTNKGNTRPYFSDMTVFEVPENNYFLLGDNRSSSTDSRSCFISSIKDSCKSDSTKAFIPRAQIRGKAWVVWWPLSNIRILQDGEYVELDQINSESLEEK